MKFGFGVVCDHFSLTFRVQIQKKILIKIEWKDRLYRIHVPHTKEGVRSFKYSVSQIVMVSNATTSYNSV